MVASIYFSNRTAKTQDIEKIKKEAERDAAINIKLDNIMSSTTATDRKLDQLQHNLDKLEKRDVAREHDVSALEERADKMERRLELLHEQFRTHVLKEEKEV